jgi:6-phosphogluconolactonase
MASSGITTVDQKNKKVVEVFDTEDELAVSLAKYTADLSDKFAKERGSFTVVVSGGSLIKSLRYLSLQSSLIKSAKLIFFLFIIGFMMMGFVGLSFFVLGFRKLVEAPYVDSIDWSKWHVFWVDERVVPKDHPDSNYKLAFDGFLSKVCNSFFLVIL